jgi:hypothetical protein
MPKKTLVVLSVCLFFLGLLVYKNPDVQVCLDAERNADFRREMSVFNTVRHDFVFASLFTGESKNYNWKAIGILGNIFLVSVQTAPLKPFTDSASNPSPQGNLVRETGANVDTTGSAEFLIAPACEGPESFPAYMACQKSALATSHRLELALHRFALSHVIESIESSADQSGTKNDEANSVDVADREWETAKRNCTTDDCMMPAYAKRIPILLSLLQEPLASTRPMERVGDCRMDSLTNVGNRLEGDELSGSAARSKFGSTVSYENIDTVSKSRARDKVLVCLIELPKDCPPGDNRGKTYFIHNFRTGDSWTGADSQHSCGGA